VATVRAGLGDKASSALEVFTAAEGLVVELEAAIDGTSDDDTHEFSAFTPVSPALLDHVVLLATTDTTIAAIAEALQADSIRVLHATDGDTALHLVTWKHPSLVILGQHLPGLDALHMCRTIRRPDTPYAREVPVILIAPPEGVAADPPAGITDWRVKPFSSVYARTRMRAWLLRTTWNWIQAALPEDEQQRLAARQQLGILAPPGTTLRSRYPACSRTFQSLAGYDSPKLASHPSSVFSV
jgi:CheY-like chemotaxis protein